MKTFLLSLALFAASASIVECNDDSDSVIVDAATGYDGNEIGDGDSLVCGVNEVYSECEADPSCQKTCQNMDNWETIPCSRNRVCVNGCVCKEGYVRDEYEGNVCVYQNRCPRVRH